VRKNAVQTTFVDIEMDCVWCILWAVSWNRLFNKLRTFIILFRAQKRCWNYGKAPVYRGPSLDWDIPIKDRGFWSGMWDDVMQLMLFKCCVCFRLCEKLLLDTILI